MPQPPECEENPAYLAEQIITYIGNKRSLLGFISKGIMQVRERLGGRKLSCLDAFSGSGIVARLLKQHATDLYVNDLEDYAHIINRCYLANADELNHEELAEQLGALQGELLHLTPGFITEMYAPLMMRIYAPASAPFTRGETPCIWIRPAALFTDCQSAYSPSSWPPCSTCISTYQHGRRFQRIL